MGIVEKLIITGTTEPGEAMADILMAISKSIGIDCTRQYLQNILDSAIYWEGIHEKLNGPLSLKEKENGIRNRKSSTLLPKPLGATSDVHKKGVHRRASE